MSLDINTDGYGVIHGSPIPRSQMSGILRWTVIENMALAYGPWSFGGSRGHLETIWLASITATVSTVSHGFQREPSIWLTQVVWVFGLTCENRCTVFANSGIMQRKRDEKSGTNVSTNVLSYSFYDSRVQLVALGGMSNMLNTGFLRQVAHLRLSLADFDIPMHAQILGKGEFTCTATANAMTLCTDMPRISSYSCLGGDEVGSVEFDIRIYSYDKNCRFYDFTKFYVNN